MRGRTVLDSLLAEFTHPALASFFAEIAAFATIPPGRIGPVDVVAPYAVGDAADIPRVTLVALADVPATTYVRHVTGALVMGNSVLLAPLSGSQALIADRARRAMPHLVRLAGSGAPTVLGDDLFVALTLHGAVFGEGIQPRLGIEHPDQLCACYEARVRVS
jgi:hypothetical protein